MHRKNWNNLQYVLAVAETGSLAAAARRLRVHHATVLRRIAAFEQDCGVKIFDRASKGYRLTLESAHVLETVKNINGLVESLGRTIANQSHSIRGPLKITTTDSMCHGVVLKHVEAFSRQYPGIQLDLLSRNHYMDFSRMEADVTIRPTDSLPAELKGTRICNLGFRVYASTDYLRTNKQPGITDHAWIGVSEPLTNAPFHNWLNAKVPAQSFVFNTDSLLTIQKALEDGQGIAFLPCALGDTSEKLGRVKSIPDYFSTGVWVASHGDRIRSPLIQTAITYFAEALERDKALLEG